MGSVNKVILVGNLGRDAELRYTPGGASVATRNMATTEVWADKGGQRREKTEGDRGGCWGGGRFRRAFPAVCWAAPTAVATSGPPDPADNVNRANLLAGHTV